MSSSTKSQSGAFFNNLASLCLQFENISCLWFRVAKWGFITMKNFSLMHSWHLPVTGDLGGPSCLLFSPKMGWQGCSVVRVFSFHTIFFDPKFLWPKKFLTQNFFDPKFFLTQIFFTQIFFYLKILLTEKFF